MMRFTGAACGFAEASSAASASPPSPPVAQSHSRRLRILFAFMSNPLSSRNEQHPETEVVTSIHARAFGPIRGPALLGGKVARPAAADERPVRVREADRIGLGRSGINAFRVGAPFPNVAVNIDQTPIVG